MSISFQSPPGKSCAQIQAAWSSEQKLIAIALRFYQGHKEWELRPGDLYCLTRHGRELFRIESVSETTISFRQLVTSNGVHQVGAFQDMSRDGFLSGFHVNRVPVPWWAWTDVVWRLDLADRGTADHDSYLASLKAGQPAGFSEVPDSFGNPLMTDELAPGSSSPPDDGEMLVSPDWAQSVGLGLGDGQINGYGTRFVVVKKPGAIASILMVVGQVFPDGARGFVEIAAVLTRSDVRKLAGTCGFALIE